MQDRFSCNLDFVKHFVREIDGELEAQYGAYRLTSSFQPIFSLAHQDVVGHEALVRAQSRTGEAVAPIRLFERSRDDFDEIFLDRLCRYLHSHNFSRQGNSQDWLFLNVSPKVIVSGKQYGDYFQSLIASANIDPGRVVVEIVEQGIDDEARLAEAAEYYRSMGCLIAIDDFGKGHSNFSRIWQLQPEIVKLDRSLIQQATSNANSRRILKRLISLIHESGSLVLIEGIETEFDALLAIDSGADFVQGFYFTHPDSKLFQSQTKRMFQQLCDMYRISAENDYTRGYYEQQEYTQALMQCAQSLQKGEIMQNACVSLIGMSHVKRCYLMDKEGWLQGQCIQQSEGKFDSADKFYPLRREKGMVWSQWREFLKAWEERGKVHVGAQHLSLNDGRLSRTLSINVDLQGSEFLLCCDLDIPDEKVVIETATRTSVPAA